MNRLLLDTSAYAAFFRDHPGVKAELQAAYRKGASGQVRFEGVS